MSLQRDIVPPPDPALDVAHNLGRPASSIVRGGDFLFVSGLTAVDPASGAPVRSGTAGETKQILANLKAMLEAAGSSLDKVVKVNVLLASMLEAPNMNEVFAHVFPIRRRRARSAARGCRMA